MLRYYVLVMMYSVCTYFLLAFEEGGLLRPDVEQHREPIDVLVRVSRNVEVACADLRREQHEVKVKVSRVQGHN